MKCKKYASHKTPVYFCPRCKDCYCKHIYDDIKFTWQCKDGIKISLKYHFDMHNINDLKDKNL